MWALVYTSASGASFNTELFGVDSGIEMIEVRNSLLSESEEVRATQEILLKPGFHMIANELVTFEAKIIDDTTQVSQGDDYNVSGITYDANGNILTLNRNKDKENGSNAMDKLNYTYKESKLNQLQRVEDAVTSETNAPDIKNQTGDNYQYNSIGQLVRNSEENIEYLYTTSGLVSEVKQNNQPRVKFYYNDKGFRVRKESYDIETGNLVSTQHYVRDISGSVMAIYQDLTQVELPIYGASRLGVYKKGGATNYELTDHLGNVRAVVTKDDPTPSIFADYYPGGMQMPNRNVQGDYRYAYQGQEKDPETGKEAFQLRLYDSRINRWLTTDPAGQYASPYLAMGNNWVSRIDPDGGRDTDPSDGAVVYGEDVPGLESITLRDIGGHVNYLDEVVIGGDNNFFNTNFDSSEVGNGLFVGSVFPSALDMAVDDFINKSTFKSIPNELRNLKSGTKMLGGAMNVASVGLDIKDLVTGEIGAGRFSYRMVGRGLSIYAATAAASGGVGIVVGGGFKMGELMLDANAASVKLRAEASAQQIHHGRINNTDTFSKSFWTEVGGHLNMSGMMNGINY